jgi:two-component system chemotaxis response regulator CheB
LGDNIYSQFFNDAAFVHHYLAAEIYRNKYDTHMTARIDAVVLGGSAGAMTALATLLPHLPENYPLPVIIVLHLHPRQDRYFLEHFNTLCVLNVKEADEKENIQAGYVYFAPPNYHLLIENNKTFSLSTDEKVNYSRPSIDVLFESAASVYGSRLAAILLTGANNDGAEGLRLIKEKGGLVVVQDPQSAESSFMPAAALQVMQPDFVFNLAEIGRWLAELPKL